MARPRAPRGVRPGQAVSAFVGLVALSTIAGVLVAATVVPGIAVTGVAANKVVGVFEGLPEYLSVGELAQPSTIYAKDGAGNDVALATFYSQNRLPRDYTEISQAAKDAAVAGEDPRFFQHGGVDFQGTVRGALSTASGKDVQGGSSITQQYVKNVLLQKCEALPVESSAEKKAYKACVLESTGVTPERKLKEMRFAIGLEKKYSKAQILTGYLNIAGFGGTVYGIEAAARYYFDTSAAALTLPQAASLVAIVNRPTSLRIDLPDDATNGSANGYAANKERRDYILGKMLDYGKITAAEHDAAVKSPIEPKITPSVRGCQTAGGAAYFCDYVQKVILNDPTFGKDKDARTATFNRGGFKIYTSLDLDLQAVAESTLNDWIPKTYGSHQLGGALVGVQPGTGRVLYMTQNKDYSQDPDVLASDSRYTAVNYNTDYEYGGSSGFQVGSTYKVFTLAEWLKQGHTLSETVNANVRTYTQGSFTNSCGDAGGGGWKPTNDSSGEEGVQSALSATTRSINTAFVAMARQLDLCKIKQDAEAFDVHTATGEELNSLASSVLGTNTIAPLTMATAFAGIANNGRTCTPIAIDKILDAGGSEVQAPATTCTQSVDPQIANTMAYALRGVTTGGTAAGMNSTPYDMLAKTGTTDNNLHVWLVAATTKVAGAYWAGNIEGKDSMRALSPTNGTTVALGRTAVQRAMMGAAASKYGGDDFPAPAASSLKGSNVAIPDLSGKSPDEAKSALTSLGLEAEIGDAVDSAGAAGAVASTDPAAGVAVPKGTTVTIHPGNGQLVPLPDVTGMKLRDARTALAGFTVEAGRASPNSVVRSTDPPPGTPIKAGATVTVAVY